MFSGLVVGLTAALHGAAGGTVPQMRVLALLALGGALFARPLVRRERGMGTIVAATLGLEAAGHVLLDGTALAGAGGRLTLGALIWCHDGVAAPTHVVLPALLGHPHLPGAATGITTAGVAGMVAVHLTGCVMLAGWLRFGEEWAWRAGRRAAGTLTRLLEPPSPTSRLRAGVPAAWELTLVRPALWRYGTLSRRGPPALAHLATSHG